MQFVWWLFESLDLMLIIKYIVDVRKAEYRLIRWMCLG